MKLSSSENFFCFCWNKLSQKFIQFSSTCQFWIFTKFFPCSLINSSYSQCCNRTLHQLCIVRGNKVSITIREYMKSNHNKVKVKKLK